MSTGYFLNSRSFGCHRTRLSTPLGQGKFDQERHALKSLELDPSSTQEANVNLSLSTNIWHQFSLLHSGVGGLGSVQEAGRENITGRKTKFCQEPNGRERLEESRKTSELWVCGEEEEAQSQVWIAGAGLSGGVIIIHIGRAFFIGSNVSISAPIIHTYHHHHYHPHHQIQQSGWESVSSVDSYLKTWLLLSRRIPAHTFNLYILFKLPFTHFLCLCLFHTCIHTHTHTGS